MQKYLALVFGLIVVGAVALIVSERPHKGTPTTTEVVRDAGPSAEAGVSGDGGPAGDAGASPVAAPEDGTASPESPSPFGDPDAGRTLLGGGSPPPLTAEAPKSVVFGVILIQYKGAQGAPASAPPREVALERANKAAADAKTDFKAALAAYGDKALSLENAGRMPRGMLEPAPEYVLFSLPKGGVSDPVDTPRGFWIVHRIE
jgi:hypothetical protein